LLPLLRERRVHANLNARIGGVANQRMIPSEPSVAGSIPELIGNR
jgi:hypothetical protein